LITAAKNPDKIPQKQQLILSELRAEIIAGKLALGSKLPTHIELAQRFAVSNVTIQRALDRLVHEGFVATNGKRGTYVTDRPPHLSHYGLIFPTGPVTDERWAWSRFWNSFVQEAARAKTEQGRDVTVYHDINERANSEDYRKLVDDIASHRLAGLVLLAPHSTGRALLPGSEKLPRVGVGSDGHQPGVIVPIHLPEMNSRALKHLASRGRKNVAIISTDMPTSDSTARWARVANAHGLETRPHWIHGVSPSVAPWSRNLARLLMSDRDERPDCLYITDDNLVEYVTAGLLDAGVRVPEELEVVAHCNFPWITPSVIPAQRLGYNVRELLRKCLDAVDALRKGVVPMSNTVEPLFEHETTDAGMGAGVADVERFTPELSRRTA
jgi:DNA-binding LacI/PurR family transcriptional regulator